MIKTPTNPGKSPLFARQDLRQAFRAYAQRPVTRTIFQNTLQTVIAIVIALIAGAILLLATGSNPLDGYEALFKGAVGSWPAFARTLRVASPILFTGLAVVIAFRAGFVYLGMEGSLYFGALGAALAGVYLAPFFPPWLHIPLCLLAGCLAGGLWALLPAIMRAFWKVDEVVSSLMFNYLAILLVDHLVYSFFQDPSSGTNTERARTLTILPSARMPFINERYGLTISILIGAALAFFLVWIYSRSVWGYEADMTGYNRKFSRFGGINTVRMAIVSIVMSGAMAGLGGATEVLGNYGRYIGGFSSDFGFAGVTVALMGRLNPIGALLGAIFFGALTNGGAAMELTANIPRDMVVIIQGLIMLIVTAQSLFMILRLTPKARPEE
jgi:general nucleoside transport system permease protein